MNLLRLRNAGDTAAIQALEGQPASRAHFDLLIDEDTDCVDADTGRLVFRFRKRLIPQSAIEVANRVFGNIDDKMPPSYSRHSAAGALSLERAKKIRPDVVAVHVDPSSPYLGRFEVRSGKVLKKLRCNPVGSYMAGFNFDRFRRIGLPTGFAKKFPLLWEEGLPFFNAVGDSFEQLMPGPTQVMKTWCLDNEVAPAFTIGRTCLSTVAVNVNYDSCFHFDRGDMRDGYSTLTVIEPYGSYDGGLLVLPGYRVAIDVREGDLLSNQSHRDLHGNTPVKAPGGAKRISFVTYLKATLRQATNKSPNNQHRAESSTASRPRSASI